MKIKNLNDLGTLVSLTGVVGDSMLRQFDTSVEKIINANEEGDQKPSAKKATILLTTYGGSILDGEAISERVHLVSPFVDLRIIAMTYVMSAGVRIFLSLPRERRFVSPGAIIMIHPMRKDTPAVTNHTLREREQRLTEELLEVEHTKIRERLWVQKLAKEMDIKYAAAQNLWQRSHRFSATEAVRTGLASAVIRI